MKVKMDFKCFICEEIYSFSFKKPSVLGQSFLTVRCPKCESTFENTVSLKRGAGGKEATYKSKCIELGKEIQLKQRALTP